MKKALPVILVALAAIGFYFYNASQSGKETESASSAQASSPPADQSSADGAQATSAEVKLSDNQTFTYRELDEYSSLDPQLVEGVSGSNVLRDLFEGLYNQDANGKDIPGVALSHTVAENNTKYTFTLRKNAKWSDGKPVTAGDFVYAWRRAVDPAIASPYAWYLELMYVQNSKEIIAGEKKPEELGVSAPDDYTFVVKLSKPLPYFSKMVVHTTTFPAPRWAIEEHGDKWTRPGNMVSNGAYVLTEHVLKERSTRERNTEYWDNANTTIDKVVTLIINDENQAFTRYQAGELDKTEIPLGQYPKLREQLPGEALVLPRLCNYYMTFNNSPDGPEFFKDRRVRQALSLAIDRKVIVEKVLKGGQPEAYNFTPVATDGFVLPEIGYAKLTQAQRDAQAVRLMEEAGYGKGAKSLKFSYLYNTSEGHKQIAVVVSQMWKEKLGVEITLENQEWKVFLDNRGAQNFQMARGAWCGDYNEASTFLDLMITDSGYNDGKFSNQRVDELMAEAKTASNTVPLYTEVEQILAEEMPVIPLYHYTTNILLKPDIKGWPVNNVEQNIYSKDLYRVVAE